jgi:bacteriophage N4 adsorption protein B
VTHGIYCDEFAEYQTIDMRAREASRSFVPSNGVGTGFARDVLDRLAAEHEGLVFDAASLTEDYEIGVRIHSLGYRQCFVPLTRTDKDFIATREFFPNTLKTAVRQRTRWITGIALQCWERQGWRGSWRTRYWFWRDRKGLITNPLSVVANFLFLAGIADYLVSIACHVRWVFEIRNPTVAMLCAITTALQCIRLGVRSICVARIFGLSTGVTVPLRSFYANAINCAAAMQALHVYLVARRQKKTLAWQKTEHHYPGREALSLHRRELVDVLLGCGYLSEEQLKHAQANVSEGSTLDMFLLARGLINEDQLCKARSLQSGFASARVDLTTITEQSMRGLPTYVEKQYGVLPFGVRSGKLLVAASEVPSPDALQEVIKLAELPVEFQLVTPSVYHSLKSRL